jgi:processive 1,2-diacylglycerol beta-glucosyltransferase
MKIIIVYASAGSGHAKAAEAVYDYLRLKPGLKVELLDVLKEANPFFRKAYTGLYSFAVIYFNWAWSICYWLTRLRPLSMVFRRINFIIDFLNTGSFSRKLISENPDVVISTHFLPPEIASYLKKKGKISSKLITVITDFGAHPYWVAEAVDIYLVPSDLAKEQLLLEGVEDAKIRVSGIPIAGKFLKNFDKISLRGKLGLAQDEFTVLIVSGSFGIGPIEKIVDLLYKDFQILVVCAYNKKLYARLIRKNYPGLKVFGFINNIEELMGSSDIIVTKPGGLTIAEFLAMGLPPVFITAIPGQESQNIKFLASYEIGWDARGLAPSRVRDIILSLKRDPQELERQREKINTFKNNFSPEELYEVIR